MCVSIVNKEDTFVKRKVNSNYSIVNGYAQVVNGKVQLLIGTP